MYWKEAVTAFKRRMNSACHQETIEALKTLPAQVQDIGELLDASTQREKALNRSMLKRILQNLCYLARQGLAHRGHGSGDNSNFTQLLQLRAHDCPEILTWMAKKTKQIYFCSHAERMLGGHGFTHCLKNCSDVALNGFYTKWQLNVQMCLTRNK